MAWDSGPPTFKMLLKAVYALCDMCGIDPPPEGTTRAAWSAWIEQLEYQRRTRKRAAA